MTPPRLVPGRRAAMGLAVLLLLAGCTSPGGDDAGRRGAAPPTTVASRVPNPVVVAATGGHGRASGGLRYDVTAYGYQEREYLFAGTAAPYPSSAGPPASYRSRMIVWTPTDPSRFNGTTVVEWAHVSDFGKFELTVEINLQSPLLEARGFAALVSAEARGICDEGPEGCASTSLRAADPERYGSLVHPGDTYSFDIFNQALQAIRHPKGVAPLGPLEDRVLIAEGFQPSIDKWLPVGAPDRPSATAPFGITGPLNAYLDNGADDDARLADAFLIDGAASNVEPARYRVPTLHHLDESAVRRTPVPDGPHHVTWEVIGAAHVDRWTADHVHLPSNSEPAPRLTRTEEEARRQQFDAFGEVPDAAGGVCQPGARSGSLFPRRFSLDAALVAVDAWARRGVRPPAAPRAERVAAVPTSPAESLARDPDGNAIGGLRLPMIEVPVATYDGETCVEAGTTTAFPPDRLASLYPTHRSYVRQLLAATNQAVEDRFLLCADARTIMRRASASAIGGTDPFRAAPRCAT